MNSTHQCIVTPVRLEPHPNADTLSKVWVDGYQCIVKTEEWQDVPYGVFIPPDNVYQGARITAKRFRGEWSEGLLVPLPDLNAALGITHYEVSEPPARTHAPAAPTPPGWGHAPKYDLEAWKKYKYLLTPGEQVVITEKIHGCNARYVWADGKLHCGSRSEWKEEGSLWHRAAESTPGLVDFCRENKDCLVYGEVYGQVQKGFSYGVPAGGVRFAAFDVLRQDGGWMPWANLSSLPWVPVLYVGPYSEDAVLSRLESPSAWDPGTLREGLVIEPQLPVFDHRLGRVKLKVVSMGYLSKKED